MILFEHERCIWIREMVLLSDPSTLGAGGPNQNTSRIQRTEVCALDPMLRGGGQPNHVSDPDSVLTPLVHICLSFCDQNVNTVVRYMLVLFRPRRWRPSRSRVKANRSGSACSARRRARKKRRAGKAKNKLRPPSLLPLPSPCPLPAATGYENQIFLCRNWTRQHPCRQHPSLRPLPIIYSTHMDTHTHV